MGTFRRRDVQPEVRCTSCGAPLRRSCGLVRLVILDIPWCCPTTASWCRSAQLSNVWCSIDVVALFGKAVALFGKKASGSDGDGGEAGRGARVPECFFKPAKRFVLLCPGYRLCQCPGWQADR